MKKLLHFSLFAFVWFSFSTVSAQDETRGSLLYKISGNGLSKPSYLYGTMHVSDRLAFRLPDTFFDAIESVDMVALEINPDSMLSVMLQTILNPDFENQYYSGGDGNFYKKLTESDSFHEYYFRELLTSADGISNDLMFRSSFTGEEYEESTYLDLFIFQSGKKLKKKVTGVEDFTESFRLEMLSLKEDMKDGGRYGSGSSNTPSIEDIESAYRRQDIDKIDSLSRKSMSQSRYKYFIVARNKNQADSLDALMRENSVFCGVGAGHLGGDSGVVSLLRQKGYTVEPVIDKLTKAGINKKKKFENLSYTLSYKSFAPADSAFFVSMPEHVYSISTRERKNMYFSPDMVNGGSYEVIRVRPNDFFSGSTPAELLKLQDSLLFECVPGEIVQRKKISLSKGINGIEVVTETREGNSLRAQLYTTGQEIIIFKVSGLEKYAVSKSAKTFFSSIKFAPALPESIQSYSDANLGIQVGLPGNRIIEKNFAQGPVANSSDALKIYAFDKGGDRRYKVIVATYNDYDYLEEDAFELEAIIREFFENEDADTFTVKHTATTPFPVAEGYGNSGDIHFFVRATLNNNRYVTLAVSSKDSVVPTEFFNSFQWIAYPADKEFTLYTDTTLFFKTRSLPQVEKANQEYFLNLMELLMGYFDDEAGGNEELYGSSETKTFSSTYSPEYAKVSYYRFPRYTYIDTTQKRTRDFSGMYGSMKVDYTKKQVSPDRSDVFITYTDTAVSRCIYEKQIIQGGSQYTVTVQADSETGLTGWSKAFFENFEPLDTVIGLNIFQPKNKLYLEDLASEDSTRRNMAEKSYSTQKIDNTCESELLKLLLSERFQKMETSVKTDLISNVSSITSRDFTDEMVKLYKVSVDSTNLQQAILRVLCRQKTQYAYDAFLKLLEYDTPLYESAGQLVLCNSSLFDSLKLTATLFPALLNYAKYPEYKKSVYVLLNTLLDSNLVDKKILKDHYKSIISDAVEEQKRFKTSGVVDNCYCEEEVMPTYGSEVYTDFVEAFTDAPAEVPAPPVFENRDHYNAVPTHELLMAILAKCYNDHADIPAFFKRTLESKNAVLLTSAMMTMDKNKIAVQDTVWTRLSRDPFVAGEIYLMLKEKNALHVFDSTCLNQLFFATAAVKNELYPGDSIIFLQKIKVEFKGHSGYMYFFKRGNSDNGWKLAVTGPFPLDDSIITDPLITQTYLGRLGKDDDGQIEMDEYCKSLFYYSRMRSGWSEYSYYNYGYDY